MAWFTAKEWKNRLVEFAGRRSLKNVSTNETTVYDVTRNEGQVSQEGDSFSATTMNDLEQRISDAFAEAEEANTQLSELAVASNLKTYTTLAQLSLSAPVTVEQIFSAMPDNSYVQIDAKSPNVVTNIPINSSGLLEISKISGGRNFARFTESVSTNSANKTMWYGVFSWSGSAAFGGWKKILERDEILATDEEIEANTDPNKIASAVAVKRLNRDLGGLSFGQDEEGNWGYIPSGADAVIPFSPPVVTLKGSMAYNLSISGGNQDSASTRIFAPEDMEIESIQYTTSGGFYGSNYMRIYDGSNNMIANRTSAGGTTITEITDRSSVAIGLYRGGQSIGGAEGNFGCSYTITFRKKSS